MAEQPAVSVSAPYASDQAAMSVQPAPAAPAAKPLADDVEQQFTDDLVAANRFKAFLIGRGIEVPREVTEGLAKLVAKYLDDHKPDPTELLKQTKVRVERVRPREAE